MVDIFMFLYDGYYSQSCVVSHRKAFIDITSFIKRPTNRRNTIYKDHRAGKDFLSGPLELKTV